MELAIFVELSQNISIEFDVVQPFFLFLAILTTLNMLSEFFFWNFREVRLPVFEALLISLCNHLKQLINSDEKLASHWVSLDFFHLLEIKLKSKVTAN